MIRMNDATSVAVLNLDDSITQLQLTQGTLNVRVRRLDPNQVIEIDTPNLAFTVRQPGDYRLMVDADGNATSIYVRKGQGEVYGEGASYVVDARQPYRFTGTGLQQYEPLAVAGLDDFDRWAIDRDRGYDTSISARYVSPDVVGYQDLDTNGTWRTDATYGNVWFPNRVEAGWAPYRDGHWAWVDPWGWTWVDDAPWGFAVSHYGRWASVRGSWGWIPGPVRSRAYYAPALVAFVGGNGFSLSISSGNVGGIAWFPLGPREVYRPSYRGQPPLFRERERQQHGHQYHGDQQLLQQLERDERHLRQPAGAGGDRRCADNGLRAVAAGEPVGRASHAADGGECSGSQCRGRRADGQKRARRGRPTREAACPRRTAGSGAHRASCGAGGIRGAAAAARRHAGQTARRR